MVDTGDNPPVVQYECQSPPKDTQLWVEIGNRCMYSDQITKAVFMDDC